MAATKQNKTSSKGSIRCAVLGASGYSGMELIRILSGHPRAEVVAATSNSYAGKSVREVFPWAPAGDELKYVRHEKGAAADADVYFMAFPHGECFPYVNKLLKKGRVIDISADFRLKNASGYERWYDYTHPAPGLLKESVYGMPELYRKQIRKARLVANPGCYPTSVILGLLPMRDLLDGAPLRVIVDAKSGYSGAGRRLKPNLLFTEGFGDFTTYKVTGHSHIGEMQQELSVSLGCAVSVSFTPHLLPVSRGILSVMYVPFEGAADAKKIRKAFVDRYADEPFVRVAPAGVSPSIKQVAGSNLCVMNVFPDPDNGLVKVVSCIDNLVKGASGQAVHNMNIMFGLPETEGVPVTPVVP